MTSEGLCTRRSALASSHIVAHINTRAQAPSMTAGPGQCYYMSSGVLMTGVNTGKTVAEIYDIYDLPLGAPAATWREPVCFRNITGGRIPKVEYYRCPL